MARALVFCCAFVLVAPAVALAEWHFTPLVGLTFKGKTSGLSDWEQATDKVHRHFGGAVSLIRGGTIGVEAIFLDAPRFFHRADANDQLVLESRSLALMGNVIVTAPRQWTEYTLRPFVSGGFGLIRVNDVTKLFPVRDSLAGFNVGGGAIGFLSKRTGLRFDFRYVRTLRPVQDVQLSTPSGVRVRYFTASIGLVIRH